MTELSPLAWRLRRCLLSLERDHIQLAEVWSCLLGAAPELVAAADRRQLLRRTVDELATASWLSLPDDPSAYDRRDPPLPRWVNVLPPSERARRLGAARAEPWRTELAWATSVELTPAQHADLLRINQWLNDEAEDAVIVPPRERSLQLFGAGHENRLHDLAASELFGDQRLSWDLLSCAPVPPPFVWSSVGPGTTLLAISGHETFASIRRVLVEAPATQIGIVAHGADTYFGSAVTFARMLDRPLERILYYGSLDASDLRTAQQADRRARAVDLPGVEPAAPLFDLLLMHGQSSAATPLAIGQARHLSSWLPEHMRDDAMKLLVSGQRLSQEWVGYELLLAERIWESFGEGPEGPDVGSTG